MGRYAGENGLEKKEQKKQRRRRKKMRKDANFRADFKKTRVKK